MFTIPLKNNPRMHVDRVQLHEQKLTQEQPQQRSSRLRCKAREDNGRDSPAARGAQGPDWRRMARGGRQLRRGGRQHRRRRGSRAGREGPRLRLWHRFDV